MIVAVTPNLAVDRTYRLPQPARPGTMTRVEVVREAAGGKGVNLARVVRTLGGDAAVAGFVGGWNGRKLRALLARDGVTAHLVEVDGETRECHILLDGGEHPTELNERGPVVPAPAWTALATSLPAGLLAVCGSLPPGGDALVGLAALLETRGRDVVVDASGAALRLAVERRVRLVAPNRRELAELLGLPRADVEDARALYARTGVPVLLTLGADGAVLVHDAPIHAAPPPVDAVNPVGSGDALLGAFLQARAAGSGEVEALRRGVAAGTDNARNGGGGRVTLAGVAELAATVVVRPT